MRENKWWINSMRWIQCVRLLLFKEIINLYGMRRSGISTSNRFIPLNDLWTWIFINFYFASALLHFFLSLSLFHFSFFILFIYTVSEPWFWNATNTHRTYLQFDHYWFDSIFNSETLIFVMVLYIHSSYKRITLVHGVPFVNSSDLLVWVCGFDCVREWHVRHTLTFIHIHRWRFVYIHIWKHMNTYVNMTCEPHQSSTFN